MTSPPNLKRLVFQAERPLEQPSNPSNAPDADLIISQIPFLRAPSAAIPKTLKSLDIVFIEDHDIATMDLTNPRSQGRSFIRDASKATLAVDVNLRILATQDDGRPRYFPPYLYGETEPLAEVVFDGDFVDPFKGRRVSVWNLLR